MHHVPVAIEPVYFEDEFISATQILNEEKCLYSMAGAYQRFASKSMREPGLRSGLLSRGVFVL